MCSWYQKSQALARKGGWGRMNGWLNYLALIWKILHQVHIQLSKFWFSIFSAQTWWAGQVMLGACPFQLFIPFLSPCPSVISMFLSVYCSSTYPSSLGLRSYFPQSFLETVVLITYQPLKPWQFIYSSRLQAPPMETQCNVMVEIRTNRNNRQEIRDLGPVPGLPWTSCEVRDNCLCASFSSIKQALLNLEDSLILSEWSIPGE